MNLDGWFQWMPRSQERSAINSDPVNLLLVDDPPENLLTLEAVLGDLGQTLVRATSGEEALKRLLETDFAVTLLDVNRPFGLRGGQFASCPRLQPPPIIFLSADASDDFLVEEAYALGAVNYLIKPLSPIILRAKVLVFVELSRRPIEAREAERRQF